MLTSPLAIAIVLFSTVHVDAAPSASPSGLQKRALPEPISADAARVALTSLAVAAEDNNPRYDRDLFRHWDTISGSCNVREIVLQRDGTDVEVNAACTPTSGSWFSVFDGVRKTNMTEISIDHIIPLKEAWVSGARFWSSAERKEFANDLVRPQLIAVTVKSNGEKGDKDPAEWLPRPEFRCTYVRAWVEVKQHYALTVDPAEKAALASILAGC